MIEPRGGPHVGMSLSPANVSIRSVIGTPSTAVSVNGTFWPLRKSLGIPVPVVEERPVVGFPRGNDGSALVVGRRDGGDVVEHRREQVGRLDHEVGPNDEIIRGLAPPGLGSERRSRRRSPRPVRPRLDRRSC